MADVDLLIRLFGDKDTQDRLRRTQKTFKELGDGMANVGRTLAFRVTAPMTLVGGAAIKMAMDAIESENLFSVSMRNMADSAYQWSEQLRTDLGLNSVEIRKQVGIFNQMVSAMGLGEQASYDMSAGLTELTHDFASFFNLRPDDAFLKLQAAIAGEVEPLRRLGIIIDETALKQVAMNRGLGSNIQQMTQAQKTVLRYIAIMEQSSAAQGDLARTLESPTNMLRILQGRVKQLSIDFGTALMPTFRDFLNEIAKPFITWLEQTVKWFSNLAPAQQKNIVLIAGLAAGIGPLLIALGALVKIVGLLSVGMTVVTGPIGIVITLLGILGISAYKAHQNLNVLDMDLQALYKEREKLRDDFGEDDEEIFGFADEDRLEEVEQRIKELEGTAKTGFAKTGKSAQDMSNNIEEAMQKTGSSIEKMLQEFKRLNKEGVSESEKAMQAWRTSLAKTQLDQTLVEQKLYELTVAEFEGTISTQILTAEMEKLGIVYDKTENDIDATTEAMDRWEESLKTTQSQYDLILDKMMRLNVLLQRGDINTKIFNEENERLQNTLNDVSVQADETSNSWRTSFANMQYSGEAVATAMHGAFQNFFMNVMTRAKSFADSMKQLFQQLVAAVLAELAKIAAAKAIASFGLSFQHGGSFIATRPQLITVGERGPEQVSVRPLTARQSGGGGQTLVLNGPVMFDDISMRKFIRSLGRAQMKENTRYG